MILSHQILSGKIKPGIRRILPPATQFWTISELLDSPFAPSPLIYRLLLCHFPVKFGRKMPM